MKMYGANGAAAHVLGWALTRIVEVFVLWPLAVLDDLQMAFDGHEAVESDLDD